MNEIHAMYIINGMSNYWLIVKQGKIFDSIEINKINKIIIEVFSIVRSKDNSDHAYLLMKCDQGVYIPG